ncbi:MAG: adenylate/guanylate cyclase domain-containing protein, partial [Alphaproteobacteria bacterium]
MDETGIQQATDPAGVVDAGERESSIAPRSPSRVRTGAMVGRQASGAGRDPGRPEARVADWAEHKRIWSVVMFADMRGFMRISEQMEPDEVFPLLNEYFELLTRITLAHGGRVFHVAGDELMAGFGVPDPGDDAPHAPLLRQRAEAGQHLARRLERPARRVVARVGHAEPGHQLVPGHV